MYVTGVRQPHQEQEEHNILLVLAVCHLLLHGC